MTGTQIERLQFRWRTRDGRMWERRMKGRWLTPAEERAVREREVKAREKKTGK